MLARFSFGLFAAYLLGSGHLAGAGPITYAFTGALAQPFHGATDFSGTFTFNTATNAGNEGYFGSSVPGSSLQFYNSPTNSGLGSIGESGADVAIKVNIGGQEYEYQNTPQDPNRATFTANQYPELIGTNPNRYQYIDHINIEGAGASSNPGNSFSNGSFSISFQTNSDPIFANLTDGQVANLTAFPISTATYRGVETADNAGTLYIGDQSISSIEVVATPEPSSLAVFTLLVGVGSVCRCRSWLLKG